MSDGDPIVIVGAGPAGVSAARTLVAAGHKPVLIDEGMFPGARFSAVRRLRCGEVTGIYTDSMLLAHASCATSSQPFCPRLPIVPRP